MALVRRASDVHRAFHDPDEVQVNQLLSIKTGACPEDCGYCSQSVHYDTGVRPEPLMDVDDVVRTARRAQRAGVTRFCMGAAWREVKDNAQFDRVCEIVRQVDALGMEVCVTLGMLDEATGPPPRRRRPPRLQPQPRHLARVLRLGDHDPDLPGPARHAGRDPHHRRHGVLRRDHRPRRDRRRPCVVPAPARDHGSAPRVGADQRALALSRAPPSRTRPRSTSRRRCA